MPPKPDRFEMIANQMMKGCNGKAHCNLAGTREDVDEFKKTYADTIRYIEETLPKSLSVGVCGALGKAILWYGKDKMAPFVEAVAKRQYQGPSDPCHVLWEWLIRNSRRNTREVYRRTVTAIRFYVRGKDMDYGFKPAIEDIFEWSDSYKNMVQEHHNQYSKHHVNQKESGSLSNSSKETADHSL